MITFSLPIAACWFKMQRELYGFRSIENFNLKLVEILNACKVYNVNYSYVQ